MADRYERDNDRRRHEQEREIERTSFGQPYARPDPRDYAGNQRRSSNDRRGRGSDYGDDRYSSTGGYRGGSDYYDDYDPLHARSASADVEYGHMGGAGRDAQERAFHGDTSPRGYGRSRAERTGGLDADEREFNAGNYRGNYDVDDDDDDDRDNYRSNYRERGSGEGYPGYSQRPERRLGRRPVGYGPYAYGRDDDEDYRYRPRRERGWLDRTEDEVASWFGDDDAERRRDMDERRDDDRERRNRWDHHRDDW
ncbi:SWFGD domain-containing protein [Pontibaca methylaminivorans]|uniref:SWFGD domain-containing protein n=1 Tax=Pontibaca methylaminivorans TaxID=515897 RepID=UPI002FD9DAB8